VNNESYNQTLIQLEQNLKDLASARDQVLSVTNLGEAIVSAFGKILHSLEEYTATASYDNTSFEEEIQNRFGEANESFKKFNAELELQLKELRAEQEGGKNVVKEAIQAEASKVSEAVLSFHEKLETSQKSFGKFLKLLRDSISDQQDQLSNQIQSLEKKFNQR